MARKPTAYFGAIPFRALADRRLGDLDIRILGVVSAHDNMSDLRGGAGCYAGTERLAVLANANATNVSTTLTKLVSLGYLARGPHPSDRRRSTFRVLYDADADRVAFKGEALPTGKTLPPPQTGDTLPAEGKYLAQTGKVSCPPSSIDGGTQPFSGGIYPEDTLNRHSVETALTRPTTASKNTNVGAQLARFERRLNSGSIPAHELTTWADWLEETVAARDWDDPLAGQASRLLDQLGAFQKALGG